jgi:hypothetical protein
VTEPGDIDPRMWLWLLAVIIGMCALSASIGR